MKVLAVDAERMALTQLENSLRIVFPQAEVMTFHNALKSFQYYLSQKDEVALIYIPLVIKPFDGFKYASLVEQAGSRVCIVYITQTDSDEIRALIRLNGGNRSISKPITPEKIRELARLEQELCLDDQEEYGDRAGHNCSGCIYHWCKNRKQENMTSYKETET